MFVALETKDVQDLRNLQPEASVSDKNSEELKENENAEEEGEINPKSQVITELDKIENLLKIENCINVQLIPGNERNLDKKNFEWHLKTFTEQDFIIWLDF